MKKALLILLIPSILYAATYTHKHNPRRIVDPQDCMWPDHAECYYFDASHTTYMVFNGSTTVSLYVNGQSVASWSYSLTDHYLTLEGNTAYARALFDKYGVKPWKSSSKCWGRTTAYSEFIELAMNEK